MKIILTQLGTYKDGGTTEYKDKDDRRYFRDGRIVSQTKGKLFDRYPGNSSAPQLNEEEFLVKTKELKITLRPL